MYILAKCNYRSHVEKKRRYRKKGESAAALSAPEEQEIAVECTRLFCSFCLKTNYDIIISHARKDRRWICPYCQGICYCTRCLRQDQLNKLRKLLYTLNGSLQHLSDSPSVLDNVIADNWHNISQVMFYEEEPAPSLALPGSLQEAQSVAALAQPVTGGQRGGRRRSNASPGRKRGSSNWSRRRGGTENSQARERKVEEEFEEMKQLEGVRMEVLEYAEQFLKQQKRAKLDLKHQKKLMHAVSTGKGEVVEMDWEDAEEEIVLTKGEQKLLEKMRARSGGCSSTTASDTQSP